MDFLACYWVYQTLVYWELCSQVKELVIQASKRVKEKDRIFNAASCFN